MKRNGKKCNQNKRSIAQSLWIRGGNENVLLVRKAHKTIVNIEC
jgi:hypothetical protein